MSKKPTYEELEHRVRELERTADCRQQVDDRLLEKQKDLLASINQAQALFISGHDPKEIYQEMANILVQATGSDYVFIDEVMRDPDGTPYKLNLAMSDIAWDTESRGLYEQLITQKLEFRNLNNLAGAPVLEGRAIIANDVPNHPLYKGLPEGHPVLNNYMGIPLYFGDEIIGVAGIANRPGGYSREIEEFIRPLTRTCASMIWAGRFTRRDRENLAALKAGEEKYRRMAETANEGIWAMDADFKTTYVNQRMGEMLGFEPEEMLGRRVDSFLFPEDLADHSVKMAARQKGGGGKYERRFRHKDGSEIWMIVSATFLRDEQGVFAGSFAMFTDITERKLAEKALLDSEKNYRDIFENSNDAIFVHDTENGQIVDVNRTACEMFGYSLEETRRMNVGDFSLGKSPYTQKEALEWIQKAYQSGPQRFEWLARNKQGGLMWFENSLLCAEIAGKKRVLVFGRNIDDRKKAEHERERLLSAIEQAAEVMVITDSEGAIQYVNPAFERVTGYTAEEVRGENPRILKSGEQEEDFYRELWETITSGRNWQGRFVNRRKDGSLYTEEASISPVMDVRGRISNFVAVKRDITSEMELETRLAQAQKMEAIGTLAGGIAHDFNNVLSAVMGYSEMARSELPEESYASQCMEEVLLASHRAKGLVKQILAFSRLSEEGMQPLKAGVLLKEAVKLLRASIPSTIEIRTEIFASRDTILANATQIHQVVMNLCTNAYHAMHDSGGILNVTLKTLDMDAEGTPGYEDLVPGCYLVLGIADTGHGMSPDIVERIFDPYFTTKEKGVGTGLGLSVVHGIVKRHGGTIRVRSLPGKGTTFHVLLPVIEEGAAVSSPTPLDAPKGTGRILFVDDEAPIANIGRQMLRRLGYDVEVAPGSMEALELFELRPDDFDLVITDMTMPHLRGDELALAVMDVRPDIPVILCTGYSDMINREKARAMGIRRVLEKPVGMLDMAGAVHDVLSGEDHSSGDG